MQIFQMIQSIFHYTMLYSSFEKYKEKEIASHNYVISVRIM